MNTEEFLLFQPKGEIADQTSWLIIKSFLIMMIIIGPVIVMSIWFPIQFRSSNKKAKYTPNWDCLLYTSDAADE